MRRQGELLTTAPVRRAFREYAALPPEQACDAIRRQTSLGESLVREQLWCRERARKKIPLFYKNDCVYTPRALEQCSSEVTARFKRSFMTGAALCDLTAGLGVDAAVLGAGFSSVTAIECDPALIGMTRYNLGRCVECPVRVVEMTSAEFLSTVDKQQFDWIYCDPSRRSDTGRKVGLTACCPDVTAEIDRYRYAARNICIKASPALEPTSVAPECGGIGTLYVLSVGGECREMLLVERETDRSPAAGVCSSGDCAPPGHTGARGAAPPEIVAVILDKEGGVHYAVSGPVSAREHTIEPGPPGRYLFEPDSAIVRARLCAAVAREYGFHHIGPAAAWMTGDHLPEYFPGRVLRVITVLPWSRTGVRRYLGTHGISCAHVARRHFPADVARIRSLVRVAEGGDDYLFFTTGSDMKKICIHGRKV